MKNKTKSLSCFYFNMKYLHLIFIVVLLNFNQHLYAQGTPGNPTDTIKHIANIVMSGNSITYSGHWKKLLGREDVTNWGIPGYTTEQISWTIKNFSKENPKVAFLEGGINDLTLGITPKRIFRNYIRMIDSLKAHNVIPVIQSTIYQYKSADKNKNVKKVNKLVSSYCKLHNIKYIDLNSVLSANDELIADYTTDGTHLKENAYVLWAKLVSEALKELNIN